MKYSSDPKTNRLRIMLPGKAVCADGSFSVNSDNSLAYWLNSPPEWRRAHNLPRKITFTGTWKLTSDDDLQMSVSRASYMPEALSGISRITINGRIIAAEGNALVFESHSTDDRGCSHARLLRLSGTWGTDDSNRITFSVSRRTMPDVLTLTGKWSVNDNQQVTYKVEKYDLAREDKTLSSVEFRGYWRISGSNRIAYVISGGSGSRLDLRAHLETPNLYPKAGVIKYRIGSGVRQRSRSHPDIICLYGQWKIGRKLGLSFDMEYEKGRFRALVFGARADVSRKDRVEFSLVDEHGADIGGRLLCAHRFLKKLDGEFFARLKKTKNERAVDAGVTIPF